MATSGNEIKARTYRRYKDGDYQHVPWNEQIFQASWTHKCPTYVQRTPPCQASCPSGHDIRGWMNIIRGIDKPQGDMPWQQYIFYKMIEANPFPSVMGRVCPAPCQDGCNRNEVEDFVGINSIEQYVGDWALERRLPLPTTSKSSGKKVALIGGGPASLAAAYQLRLLGHACTIFDDHSELGGMMRYGIPGYRTPRDVLDLEIQRIVDTGVEARMKTRIGRDVTLAELEAEFDAVFWGIGAQSGKPLPVPGGDAVNCITGVAFLDAFNDGRLKHVSGRVLVIGGGDTSIDVASVARRLGHIETVNDNDRPEFVVLGQTAHDVATTASRQGAQVTLLYRRPMANMPAAQKEIEDALREGVEIRDCLAPVAVIVGPDGRATALRVAKTEVVKGRVELVEGSEFEIETDLIVSATGQVGDFTGFEEFDNGKGLMSCDRNYRVSGKTGHFVGGDVLRPHLLTTAIGQARVAADTIDQYLAGKEPGKRPKYEGVRFNMLEYLRQVGKEIGEQHGEVRGTAEAAFAIHNYEDRSAQEVIPHDRLFLGYFGYEARERREEVHIGPDEVLGNFEERLRGLTEEQALREGQRCMSCGLCFECDACVVYCPQDAVFKVNRKEATYGRYVDTDYAKCIGCHICADVCPTGYIQMALGE
jgi:NADPH-dependent glutamate synthase beta subunit-like oxidoreductase